MPRRVSFALAAAAVALFAGTARGAEPSTAAPAPADAVVAAISDADLRRLLGEVLARNPELAGLAAAARAAELEAPQAASLPDPVAMVTAYPLTPETRVGPVRAMAGLSQTFPWFGKLGLRERAAVVVAAEARETVEAARLRVVTEARELVAELGFVDADEQVLRDDRATLARYEELARARYASGQGLEQAAVKIQAEITRTDGRLLDLATHRAEQRARLNALRDRPASTEVPAISLPSLEGAAPPAVDAAALRARAVERRPEVAGAAAAIERARVESELAAKQFRPDVTLGFTYTLVDRRTDAPGRASPPPGNGDDDLGLTASLNLPVRKRRLEAGVAQAAAGESAAADRRRSVVAAIEETLGDLVQRLPLTAERLHLFQRVLLLQARESLASAEAAYAAGTLDALDLLDAERVLLEVRTATERARADYAIALADLDGAVGAPALSGAAAGDTP
jgi:outer membrane protein, heavy metal efflux system